MHHIDEIAAARPDRMEAMVFGVADYAASLQSHTTSIGGSTPAYSVRTDEGAHHWGDQWHYPLARIAVACRANGLRPIDGPYGDFGDPEGYRAAARRAAVLGYEGKWAIHPSQVPLANGVFTPDAAAAEKTRRIIGAMREAAREGRGAVSLDGRLIDAASLRMAEGLLRKLEQIEARQMRAGGRAQRPSVRMNSCVASSIGPIAPRTSARPARSSASPTSTGIIESCSSARISSASATVSAARSRLPRAPADGGTPVVCSACSVAVSPCRSANPVWVRFARPSAVCTGRKSASSIRSALCSSSCS